MMTNRFGVLAFLNWNHDWNSHHFPDDVLDRSVAQIAELGVSFVRMDFLWVDIHRGYHQYDFSRMEKIVRRLTDHKIHILGILNYNKEYVNAAGSQWNQPPDSFEEFAAYVNATVSSFKNEVFHWEIWNEPNLHIYWNGPKDSLRLYSSLLKLSYQAAKDANPRCLILNGGITEPVIQDLENLYRNGGKKFTDIINIHTFVDPKSDTAELRFDQLIVGVQSVMKKFDDADKKIWITEMGCPGVPPEKSDLSWFGGKSVNESEQADWLEKQFSLAKNYPQIEKMFWAFYRDTPQHFNDASDHLGLVHLDLSPKPAFHRLKELIRKEEFKN